MTATVRGVVQQLFGYLTKEQRTIPHVSTEWQDPLPYALEAINGALQEMAVLSPLFAAKQQRSAYFRAPASVSVSGLTRGGKTATATWPTGAAGCLVQLPGDSEVNRILSISGTTATLQFPHISDDTTGTATVSFDTATLDSDVVTVLEPVRVRGGSRITAATGREQLSQPSYVDGGDFGRPLRVSSAPSSQAYYIETAIFSGASQPALRMMLRNAPAAELVVEFQARCGLGRFTSSDVYAGSDPQPATPIPVPSSYIESIFYPLALFRFFSSPVLRNADVPEFVATQARTAQEMLKSMQPQGRKDGHFSPGL